MTETQPLYRKVANELRAEITGGKLKPGELLPTEMTLCETHGISRHTAREALRLLTEAGLIERRRGAGTIVKHAAAPAFAQPLGDFEAILQYARDARFKVVSTQNADDEALDRVGLTGPHRQFVGFRQVRGQPPIAITAVYVPQEYAPDTDTVNALSGPVSEWIEAEHAVSVARVVQRMEAVALNESQAERLGVESGSPALRTIRRYRDSADRIILLSESLHPSGRFAYEMRLDRKL